MGASNYAGQVAAEGQTAAIALMRRLGLPAGKPAVLSSRGNLIVHFPAARTVARVATLTAWQQLRPGVVWSLAMAHLYPARYAESAQRLLEALLNPR